ncbi:MAG TPA: hypothetical protein VKU82_11815 [Planctomycetaceae bacterium]|nr:hypothetical protein [Planctomycetaceae bacterium]
MKEHQAPQAARSKPAGRLFGLKVIRGGVFRLKSDLAIWASVRAFPPLAILAALNCLAALLAWRERSGATLRLTNLRLCTAAFAAAALTIGSRWLLARIERQRPAFWIRALLAALSVLPIVVLLSSATSRHSPWAVSFVSALAVAAGNANLLWNRRSGVPRSPAPQLALGAHVPDSPAHPKERISPSEQFAQPSSVDDVLKSPISNAPHPPIDAWFERSTDAAGATRLRGKIAAEFPAGQSFANLHIPFFPPFARIPEFSCKLAGVPSVRAKAPAVYRYGARVELKRSGDTASALRVEVEFVAIAGEVAAIAA